MERDEKGRKVAWHCPHCNWYYDTKTEPEAEEFTVGSIFPDAIPHIGCPGCHVCMGCSPKGRKEIVTFMESKGWERGLSP